ncbi:MAG: hypothetical protein K1X92_07265 [Bacteroidia bacterium]|nr:hypothetical protein [Bacteroidia bacterium]
MKKLLILWIGIIFCLCLYSQNILFSSATEYMEIKNGVLQYRVTTYTYSNPVSSVPTGSDTRVIFSQYLLKGKTLKRLKTIIRRSNFYSLPAECGASPKERHYPESLMIEWKGRKHKVSFRSHPEYPAPYGYEKIKSEIFNEIDRIK